jgi:hypothetical protein
MMAGMLQAVIPNRIAEIVKPVGVLHNPNMLNAKA